MACTIPARVIGRRNKIGMINKGYEAKFVITDDNLHPYSQYYQVWRFYCCFWLYILLVVLINPGSLWFSPLIALYKWVTAVGPRSKKLFASWYLILLWPTDIITLYSSMIFITSLLQTSGAKVIIVITPFPYSSNSFTSSTVGEWTSASICAPRLERRW